MPTLMADPQRLGKYTIKGVLGKGAMGVVYRGLRPWHRTRRGDQDHSQGPGRARTGGAIHGAVQERGQAAGRLHHPNIVGIYEYGESDDVTFIAMEYIEGTGLRAYLNARTHFDFAQLVELMSQLLDALDFAHSRGIVHRDIKPSNLIITNKGLLKVADFGVARVDTSNLTVAGMVIGTPSYMSPEQCRGLEVDGRSDLFSAGIVLYELLTGEKPFRGTVQAITHKICHEEPEPPSRVSTLSLPVGGGPPGGDGDGQGCGGAVPGRARIQCRAARNRDDAGRSRQRPGQRRWSTLARCCCKSRNPIGTMKRCAPPSTNSRAHWGRWRGVIVHRAAARTRDRAELCSMLSDNITDPESRQRFVAAFNRSGSGLRSGVSGAGGKGSLSSQPTGGHGAAAGSVSSAAHSTASRAQRAPIDQAFVDQISAQLAVYLGPIAPIVTRKAARDAKSRSDLVLRVADSLGTQERAAFLRDTGFQNG